MYNFFVPIIYNGPYHNEILYIPFARSSPHNFYTPFYARIQSIRVTPFLIYKYTSTFLFILISIKFFSMLFRHSPCMISPVRLISRERPPNKNISKKKKASVFLLPSLLTIVNTFHCALHTPARLFLEYFFLRLLRLYPSYFRGRPHLS